MAKLLGKFFRQALFPADSKQFFFTIHPAGILGSYLFTILIQPIEVLSQILSSTIPHGLSQCIYILLDFSIAFLCIFFAVTQESSSLIQMIKSTAYYITILQIGKIQFLSKTEMPEIIRIVLCIIVSTLPSHKCFVQRIFLQRTPLFEFFYGQRRA